MNAVDALWHRGVVRARHDDEIDVALPHALKHRRFDLEWRESGPTRHIHAAGVRGACALARRVHREGRGQVQEAAPRAAPSEGHIEQKLVAAVAQKDIGAVEPVGLGDEVAQAVGQRIGIAVQGHLGNAARDGGAHLGVHVARILVGRQVRLGRQVPSGRQGTSPSSWGADARTLFTARLAVLHARRRRAGHARLLGVQQRLETHGPPSGHGPTAPRGWRSAPRRARRSSGPPGCTG